jgi:hypothetical protein
MKRNVFCCLAILVSALCGLNLRAETNQSAILKLPPKEKLQLYLLMGQSNMAGRGELETEDTTTHPRVLMFGTNSSWEVAVEPITKDPKKKHGVGPGLAFGKAMAEKNPGVVIGLVPCAIGGTPLKRWVQGADLYSNAVVRARLAMKSGTLKGFLWHQGEGDSLHEADAKSYGERLAKMIQDIRGELGVTNAPFVVGQIGEFLYAREGNPCPFAREINQALLEIPSKVARTGCAKSNGLNHKGDVLHFDAASQREFGRRYAVEMMRLNAAAR